MRKFFINSFLLLLVSCTDQGKIVSYAVNNKTGYNMEAILYDRFGKNDTTFISKNDFKIMYKEGPPYDDGPFGSFDSLKIIFKDSKILTYSSLLSNDECVDSIKNPFCRYNHYYCFEDVCSFDIDDIEYLKAK